MRVVDDTGVHVAFHVIPDGFSFLFEDMLYMPVRPFDVKQIEYNAVCLTDGQLYRFQSDAQVVPCVTEVHITKRGSFSE